MQTVKQVVWHRQGDYLAVVTDGATATTTVIIHRLSKRQSQARTLSSLNVVLMIRYACQCDLVCCVIFARRCCVAFNR